MAKTKSSTHIGPMADITRVILVLRRQRVILDADLAALYGVTTKRLNEQVERNGARFPEDFMFRLSAQETDALNRSHFATGSQKHRDPRFPPFAFTEHGAIMAATVLNRPRLVEMSLYVVRAFIRLRELLAANSTLARNGSGCNVLGPTRVVVPTPDFANGVVQLEASWSLEAVPARVDPPMCVFAYRNMIKFDRVQLMSSSAYSPIAHGEQEYELKAIRKQLLSGDQSLKMEVASFPVDADALKAQTALSTALAAALAGQGAFTVAIKPTESKPT